MSEVSEPVAPKRPPRLPFLDGLRGLAAVVIVLHHATCYGPLPELFVPEYSLVLHTILYAIWEQGRLAVQVFFVLSGFTAIYTLPNGPIGAMEVGRLFLLRYLRLALPCAAAIGLHFVVHYLVGEKNLLPPLIDPFTVDALAVHFLFLQNVLGYESMFVAYWYLAIEVQFMLLLLTLTAVLRGCYGAKQQTTADEQLLLMLGAMAAVSVFYWNRHPEFDCWVIYFLGSYFVGVLVAAIVRERCSVVHFFGFAALTLFAAGWPEPRVRPLIALAVGGLVLKASRSGGLETWLSGPVFRFLGRISYSLFLTHVPILRVITSWGYQRTGADPAAALLWMGLGVAASILFAWFFADFVERPLLKRVSSTFAPRVV